MGRSFRAILAGFFIVPLIGFTVQGLVIYLSPESLPNGQVESNAIALLLLLGNSLGILVGCYVTAAIHKTEPMKHALILGVIGQVIALYFNLSPDQRMLPSWAHAVAMLQVMPLAWLAGKLYLSRHRAG